MTSHPSFWFTNYMNSWNGIFPWENELGVCVCWWGFLPSRNFVLGWEEFSAFCGLQMCLFVWREASHEREKLFWFPHNPWFHCLVQCIFSVKKGKNELIFLKISISCRNGSRPECNRSLSSGNRIMQSMKFSCCTSEEVQMPSHFLNQFDDHI